MQYQVQGHVQTQLSEAVIRFIRNDLLKSTAVNPIWVAGPWNRSNINYAALFRRFTGLVCSTCTYRNTEVAHGSLTITFPGAQATQAQFNTVANHAHLDHRTRLCLADAGVTHSVFVWCYIRWEGRATGHAVFLMFDKKRKLQIVFDPHSGLDGLNGRVVSAMAQREFYQGYTPVPVEQCTWLLHANSIQHLVQNNMHIEEHGICGLMCILVMITCMRFNFYNPKVIADMLVPALSIQHCGQLISWYDEILTRVQNNAHVDTIISRLLPDSEELKCLAYSQGSGRLCSRGSCSAGTTHHFCWQHRYIVLNNKAGNRKCVTQQSACIHGPNP